jgi:hypothetical protein
MVAFGDSCKRNTLGSAWTPRWESRALAASARSPRVHDIGPPAWLLSHAKAIATTTNPAKAAHARALGFDHVIDLSAERLGDGVSHITGGRGVDMVIESVGGALTGEALATLALHGVLTTLGYSAGRQATIDVTDLIWKRARMSGFALAAQLRPIRAFFYTGDPQGCISYPEFSRS